MAIRLAINGLGRISAQLVRVVDQGGFSDLFEIVEIHDAAGPDGIYRALRNDAVYGPFPREMALDGELLTVGEQTIRLASFVEAKSPSWGKSDIALVIVDGSAPSDQAALDQHFRKGAKKVILPSASELANVNLGIGINEGRYDSEAHTIVASAAGAPSAICMLYQLIDQHARVRVGNATVVAPAAGTRPLLDSPIARGGSTALLPVTTETEDTYDHLIGKLSNRLNVTTLETPALAVGAISFGVWVEQRTSMESLRELVTTAAESDELMGLIGEVDSIDASTDMLRDSRSLVVDWSGSQMRFETFVTLKGWYDAEWGAACRLADLLALICEEGVPGTA